MRRPTLVVPLVAAITSSLVVAGAGGAPSSSRAADADDDPLACGEATVERTLENGASWRMCARVHPVKGLVLEQIEFKPASTHQGDGYLRVLDEIYLGQLNVPYDSGLEQWNDITSYGFGNYYLLPQNEVTCTGDTLDIEQAFSYAGSWRERTIPGICLDEVETGLATHSSESDLGTGPRIAAQGTALEVSSLSKISWYEYQERLTFGDQGTIDVGLGATGDLAPGPAGTTYFLDDPTTGWPLGGAKTPEGKETHAASHWHSAIWRVDFGVGGAGDQFVEQWDYDASETGERAPITRGTGHRRERAFNAVSGRDHDALTWWRVGNDSSRNRDGHARSYEIVNRNTPNESIPFTQPVVTFMNDRECAEYASDNLDPGCQGADLLSYVRDDSEPLVDPVAWVNVGFHHIDRDEDQSPMPVHWQSFQLVPRDFFAQSPSTPESRVCINGAPGESIDSVRKPCIATNIARPSISSSSSPAAPGTLLTARDGLWNEVRTKWVYSYMWFRDGEAIMSADADGRLVPETDPTYVVTGADAGAEITVKVTASQTGFVSGTAESRPLTVAGTRPGTPTPTSPTPTSPTPTSPTASPPTAGPPPVQRPVKARSVIRAARTKTVRRGKRARITIRVKAAGSTVPRGRVTVVRGKKRVRGQLRAGVVRLRLPKMTKPGRYRFVIRYHGSTTTKPATKVLVVKVRR